jgi:serine/threonine-protein kinase HipA
MAQHAGLSEKQVNDIFIALTSGADGVSTLVRASFLSEGAQRNFWQGYQSRLKNLTQC